MNVENNSAKRELTWVYDLLLILILLIGAYFRFVGMDWDEDQHLHPDERFLSSVESALEPVENLGDYFDTANSSLNPHNSGHNYFVYGTFPIFLTRYVGEWTGQVGYGPITLVGRYLSALADLLVVVVVYLAASRLYDKRVGILAAAFSAFTVLQIQVSHFFAVDTFLNLFIFLSIYFAILVATDTRRKPVNGTPALPESGVEGEAVSSPEFAGETPLETSPEPPVVETQPAFTVWHFVLFGVAFGLAMASKVSALPVAAMLPLAVVLRMLGWTPKERQKQLTNAFAYLMLGAVVSLLVFRIFQPYAFKGPGFFGIGLNENWLANIQSQRAQAHGEQDWPPSIQWARRTHLYSFENLFTWGLGIPLGIAAWGGLIWVTVLMARRKQWRRHLLLWAWTVGHFLWQSMAFNPTMRYQLPIYPPLAVYAGWAVIALWDYGKSNGEELRSFARNLARPLAIVVGGGILLATCLYAFAFTRIYTRPVTRVEATRWIYQNIPGPITLPIEGEDGIINQQISVPYGRRIEAGAPFTAAFMPKQAGELSQVKLKYIETPIQTKDLMVRIADATAADEYILDVSVPLDISYRDTGMNTTAHIPETPVLLTPESEYILRLELPFDQGDQMVEFVELSLLNENGMTAKRVLGQPQTVSGSTPFLVAFNVDVSATIAEVFVSYFTSPAPSAPQHDLGIQVSDDPGFNQVLASGSVQVDTSVENPDGYTLDLDKPIKLEEDLQYYLRLVVDAGGPVELYGSALANESTWDDGLPLRMEGYDGYGGIYQQDLVLELYWDANQEKRERMLGILDKAEYLLISSSRVWASTPRIPERFPLAVTYYRNLLGCPEDKSIEWCYNVADVGRFEGNLGFELVQVFQSDPTLGSLRINDQPSEEAFTVYDHPKVFIFKKTADYDPANVRAILETVDLSQVVRLTPKQASRQSVNTRSLMLSRDSLERQQAGGTWSDLFDTGSIFNSFHPAGVVLWYLAVFALGLTAYPLVRAALPGLRDRGYPLGRAAGMLLLSYGSWVAGSLGIAFTPLTIGIIWALILLAAAFVVYRQRDAFAEEWRGKRKYFLIVEGLFLALFLAGLLIRMGNPDLWHPAKGGEKPMNLSYFTAVLKSTTFPPYDPWYAGGYLNYYYYGYVYVGTLVKLLGIMPSFAYNLILPTLLSMIAIGAFSCAWNLYLAYRHKRDGAVPVSPWIVGGSAGLLMAVLGNLGSIRMILRGYARLGASRLGAQYETTAWIFKQAWWTVNGLIEAISGGSLPYGLGDWYWFPSRVIDPRGDVEPITEFPMFTFLYADLHAHLIVLPIALLALAWVLSVMLGRAWEGERQPGVFKPFNIAWSFVLGGLAISLLLPTNTWDYPLYLALGILAVVYTCVRYFRLARFEGREFRFEGIVAGVVGAVLLFFLFKTFQLPFTDWFVQGYSSVEMWQGSNTYLKDYLTHWGIYLFIIVTWLLWETRQWLAHTPIKALRKVIPYIVAISVGLILAAVALVVLQVMDVRAVWVVLPVGLWTAVLLLRPNYPDNKRAALFMFGTGLFLTLMVEIIVLAGDIGRMNTVFKFYLQVWTLYAVVASAALGWTLSEIRLWRPGWRVVWQVGLALLVAAAALFPLFGTMGKIKDRMAADAPATLDGMTYMQYAQYHDQGEIFELEQDYDAIRWMQENVSGSPVIVEGNTPEYRWGSRFTIYTGLPGVVGWNWHQRQQRGFVVGLAVEQRVAEIGTFYTTTNLEEALSFLRRYDVKYIVVGQLERAYHPGEGLDKFEAQDGVYWREVYRTGDTVIYEVLDQTLAVE